MIDLSLLAIYCFLADFWSLNFIEMLLPTVKIKLQFFPLPFHNPNVIVSFFLKPQNK